MSPDDIVAFDRIFSELHVRAYSWDVWGAAYVIGGGCSDDGFMDFRGWLISRGRDAYEAALRDAETLGPEAESCNCEGQIEGFQYIGPSVWEEKTGKPSADFPRHAIERPAEPVGVAWSDDDLAQRFPRLYAQYG